MQNDLFTRLYSTLNDYTTFLRFIIFLWVLCLGANVYQCFSF